MFMSIVLVMFTFLLFYIFFFFFKQKTAYEMRISDWSSDVCSSDLMIEVGGDQHHIAFPRQRGFGMMLEPAPVKDARQRVGFGPGDHFGGRIAHRHEQQDEPGRDQHHHGAALRDRSEEHTSELQSLMRISYAVFCLKKKKTTKNNNKSNRHQQKSNDN